jgi:glycine cleavage system transcriptional repressor
MARSIAITVVGIDRPGIVASITKVLFEHGCNLEDATSTILRGHFAMVLVVQLPSDKDIGELEASLSPIAAQLEVTTTVRSIEGSASKVAPPTHMVSVYGADHPGIVARVAERLTENDINVTDLASRVIGEESDPVYTLLLEVAAPDGIDLWAELASLKDELGVEVSVHPIDPDIL